MIRVSIFMSVFDVHINRTPIGGTIKQVVYISGKFLNADLDKASEDNERQHILVERHDGVRIGLYPDRRAGRAADRAVCEAGRHGSGCQRIGLIRFGSRVDVYCPQARHRAWSWAQRTVAGETILGQIGNARVVAGIQQ